MFILAQIFDLVALFILIYFFETCLSSPRIVLHCVIYIFFSVKLVLLYTYTNKRRYNLISFLSPRIFLLVCPMFVILFKSYEIIGRIILMLLIFSFGICFNNIRKVSNLNLRIWKGILIVFYGISLFVTVLISLLSIGELS